VGGPHFFAESSFLHNLRFLSSPPKHSPTSRSGARQPTSVFVNLLLIKTATGCFSVMADGQRALAAAFPPPPPFWKHFTSDNIERLEKIKKESTHSSDQTDKTEKKWSPSKLHALDVPPGLRYLIPPEAPTEGSYSVFGELQSVCNPVSLLSVTQ
jgi:MED7 protein